MQKVVFHKMSPHDTLFIEESVDLEVKYVCNNQFVQFQIWDFPGDYDLNGTSLYCLPCGCLYRLVTLCLRCPKTDTIHYGDVELTEDDIFRCKGVIIFVIDAQVLGHPATCTHSATQCPPGLPKSQAFQLNPFLFTRTFLHGSPRLPPPAACCEHQDKPYNAAIERLHEIATRAASINPGLHLEVFIHKADGDQFGAADRKTGEHSQLRAVCTAPSAALSQARSAPC